MERFPVIYIRGFAGPTAGIDAQVDDPFYGFNNGATHVRINGEGNPAFYQFEGPLVRLITDEKYELYVQGSQQRVLDNTSIKVQPKSLWIYRFYDEFATTFKPAPEENLAERLVSKLRHQITAEGFNIENAAQGLYELVVQVRTRTGADKVYLVAHSMGGLIARCMIQKVSQQKGRTPGSEMVAKLFTYGTPHGGIRSAAGVAQWVESTFNPAGSNIFAPDLMQGYLDPSKNFGDDSDKNWDPRVIDDGSFDADNIFCLVGTDPADYGWGPRTVVGPQSDGLVQIENAYVRNAHRAFVHKSHSGSYGEVNSEEGYQNLRRFLFGRWAVTATLIKGLIPHNDVSYQLDMRLSIRGNSVVISEQTMAHWCPIMLSNEQTPTEVTLARTFLLDPSDRADNTAPAGERQMRYMLTLRLFAVHRSEDFFDFRNSTEQVPLWEDTLIVDVDPVSEGTGLVAYAAWNSTVPGANQNRDPIISNLPDPEQRQKLTFQPSADSGLLATVPLPKSALQDSVLGSEAAIRFAVSERS